MDSNETGPEPGVELKSTCDKRNGSAHKVDERCDGPLRKKGTNERWAKLRRERHRDGITCDGERK